jgi:hypothetical protein
MDTIFEYLQVKATAVSVRLRIYLRALIYTNSHLEATLIPYLVRNSSRISSVSWPYLPIIELIDKYIYTRYSWETTNNTRDSQI